MRVAGPLVVCSAEATPGPLRDFPPFELLFDRKSRGVLDLITENQEEGPSTSKNEILDLQHTFNTSWTSEQNSMGTRERITGGFVQGQERERRLYDRGSKLLRFSLGDKVLVLLPSSKWCRGN